MTLEELMRKHFPGYQEPKESYLEDILFNKQTTLTNGMEAVKNQNNLTPVTSMQDYLDLMRLEQEKRRNKYKLNPSKGLYGI